MMQAEEILRATKREPLEAVEKLGSVSAPKSPLPCAPFESQEPFPLDSNSFKEAAEIADALIAGTEIGEEIIDFSRPIGLTERNSDDRYFHPLSHRRPLRHCPYCHYSDQDEDGAEPGIVPTEEI